MAIVIPLYPHINAQAQSDPSRTLTLRARFMRQMNARWDGHKRDIRLSIVDNDCFGIQPDATPTLNIPASWRAFDFPTTVDKVDAFMGWLEKQEAAGILELVPPPRGVAITAGEQPWTNSYVDSAYQRGIRQGRAELRAQGVDVLPLEEFELAGFNQPLHVDRVAQMYMRTFEELKSVTGVTNQAVRREIADGLSQGLARGLAEGKHPITIARELYKNTAQHIDKIGKVRCRMIARTELMRSNNEARMAEYELAAAQGGFEVKIDILLSSNPCEVCVELEAGGPYTLAEGRGLLPAHTNCECASTPVVVMEQAKAQAEYGIVPEDARVAA